MKIAFPDIISPKIAARTPLIDAIRQFAPDLEADDASSPDDVLSVFAVLAMYMPVLLDDASDFWGRVDKGIEKGTFKPGSDFLLIDCAWEAWDFKAEEFMALHERLTRRGIPLCRVAMVQMCLAMPEQYRTWAVDACPDGAMQIYAYWGSACKVGEAINAAFGDDSAFDARLASFAAEIDALVPRDKRFLCMNNMVKVFRTATALMLWERAPGQTALSHGRIESLSRYQVWHIGNWLAEPDGIEGRLERFAAQTPFVLDVETGSGAARKHTTYNVDRELFDTAAMSVVTESDMSSTGKLRATEKIYKPLGMGHPFVLCGNAGVLAQLRAQGYRTFAPFIDESYDEIADGATRMRAAHAEIHRLIDMDDQAFYEGIRSVRDSVLHNMVHLRQQFAPAQGAWLSEIMNAMVADLIKGAGELSVTAGRGVETAATP